MNEEVKVPEELQEFEFILDPNAPYVLDENGVACSTEQAKADRMKRHYRACGIPEAYIKFSIEHYTPQMGANGGNLGPQDVKKKESVRKLMESYLKVIHRVCGGWPLVVKRTKSDKQGKEISSLMLRGGLQSGKTMLASIIAKEAAGKFLQVRYHRYADLTSDFMSLFDNKEKQDDIVKEFGYVDLVVIDGLKDVAVDEKKYEGLANNLERLARARADSGKPTIITIDNGDSIGDKHPMRSLIAQCTKINLPSDAKSDSAI